MRLRRHIATACLLIAAGTAAAQTFSDYAGTSSAFALTGTDPAAGDWGISDMGLDAPPETGIRHYSDAELDALLARWITQPPANQPVRRKLSREVRFNNLLVIPEDQGAAADRGLCAGDAAAQLRDQPEPRSTRDQRLASATCPFRGNGTLTLEGNVYFIGGVMVCILARGTCAKVLRWVR